MFHAPFPQIVAAAVLAVMLPAANAAQPDFSAPPPVIQLAQSPDPQDLDADAQAMADLMAALMGAVAGAGTEPAYGRATPSPTLLPLGARSVDLQGIAAADLMDLVLPAGRDIR